LDRSSVRFRVAAILSPHRDFRPPVHCRQWLGPRSASVRCSMCKIAAAQALGSKTGPIPFFLQIVRAASGRYYVQASGPSTSFARRRSPLSTTLPIFRPHLGCERKTTALSPLTFSRVRRSIALQYVALVAHVEPSRTTSCRWAVLTRWASSATPQPSRVRCSLSRQAATVSLHALQRLQADRRSASCHSQFQSPFVTQVRPRAAFPPVSPGKARRGAAMRQLFLSEITFEAAASGAARRGPPERTLTREHPPSTATTCNLPAAGDNNSTAQRTGIACPKRASSEGVLCGVSARPPALVPRRGSPRRGVARILTGTSPRFLFFCSYKSERQPRRGGGGGGGDTGPGPEARQRGAHFCLLFVFASWRRSRAPP